LSIKYGKMYSKSKWDLEVIHMPTLREFEQWLSTGQMSKILSRSRQGVINLAEDKSIRAVKTAAGWLYDPDSVKDFERKDQK
jgi:hypothetical protein